MSDMTDAGPFLARENMGIRLAVIFPVVETVGT